MSNIAICAHCSLPFPGVAAPAASSTDHDLEYCCFGCKMAADMLREGVAEGELGRTGLRLGLAVFLSFNVMIFTMWLWTQEVYGPDEAGDAQAAGALWNVCRYACLVFSMPVLWLLGRPVAEGAWDSLRRRAPTTDVLMILGTAAAYGYSLVSTIRGAGPVYFEIGCGVLVFVTVGRFLEARGKHFAAAALESLEKLLPDDAQVLVDDELRTTPLSAVIVGDRLVVRAGERIPVDGRIVRGTASIDTRVLTGESRAMFCEVGDVVLGGSLDLDGDLTVEVIAPASGGTWRRLLDCMRSARQIKGRHQRIADVAARWFMPLVAVIAAGTFAYHASTASFDQGLLAALAVVLVACPCALGLATPMAVWSGLGSAARAQVVFRHGEALERLADVRVAAFDKTGTLTDGHPIVALTALADEREAPEVIGRTLSVASAARHDLSQALVDYCRERQIGVVPKCDVRTQPGRGLAATFADDAGTAYLGSVRLMQESGLTFSTELERAVAVYAAAAMPLACIGWDGTVRAAFGFAERLREAAHPTLAACAGAGLQTIVLTGDHAARGTALSAELGVPVCTELLPDEKVDEVVRLRRRFGPVVMIGDGLNDAPALTAADVGMALGCGADVSRQSADVCLLGDDLNRVAWSVGLARHTIRVVRQNLFWSFAYNAVGIALAAVGWLNPIWAAAAMAVGGLSVIGNSLRPAHYPQPDAEAITVVGAGVADEATLSAARSEAIS